MTDDLLAALAAMREDMGGDPWHRPKPYCQACDGSGSLQIPTFRGYGWRECWDCNGTGNSVGGNAPTAKDESDDE